MKTFCVGRFLVDLPESAVVSFSRAFVDGFEITTHPDETDEQFASRTNALEAEISAQLNQRGKQSLESAKPIQQQNWAGKVFVYGREWTEMPEGERKAMLQDVTVQALARSDGISFALKADGMAPGAATDVRKQIDQLRPFATGEIPVEPGFCIDRGVLRDDGVQSRSEQISMVAGLPGHPDLSIVFSTMTGTKRGPGLLVRNAAARAHLPLILRAGITTIREGVRDINGLLGEESLARIRELNLTTGFNFEWERDGRKDDVNAPLITLELDTGTTSRASGKPVQSSLSEQALVELWEKIAVSIRRRPGDSLRH